jgi:hypothetical protein
MNHESMNNEESRLIVDLLTLHRSCNKSDQMSPTTRPPLRCLLCYYSLKIGYEEDGIRGSEVLYLLRNFESGLENSLDFFSNLV